jgi:sec-independent protein translocase protein TatB
MRTMMNSAQEDLRRELGPEFANLDVRDLNPRSFVRKHLLEGIDSDDADDRSTKPVSGSMNGSKARQTLAPGQLPPYDPEST